MREKTRRDTAIGVACALICNPLYGLSYVFSKHATETASPLALLGWRFCVGAVVMTLLALPGLLRIHLRGKALRPLLLAALCCPVIYFLCEAFGIRSTTACESSTVFACIPIASLAASSLILHKRPTALQAAGITVTLAGVLVTVFAVSSGASFSLPGYALLAGGVVSYALYSVLVEKLEGFTGAEITYVMLLCGAAVFAALALGEAAAGGTLPALLRLPLVDRGFRTAVLYQGVGCSIVAFFLNNAAIQRIGVNRNSTFIGVATVVSIAAGALVLREPFTSLQMVGAAVIIAGVCLANAGKAPARA